VAVALTACGGAVEGSNGDAGASDASAKDSSLPDGEGIDAHLARIPKVHRPSAMTCPSARGTEGDAGLPGDCTKDSDCTMGTNGRCVGGGGGPPHVTCSYDTCSTDTDCAGGVCVCRSGPTDVAPNFCGSSKSNCRVDADCGPGGYCSPSESSDAVCYQTLSAYFCHTAQDECTDDTDCTMGTPCSFDPGAAHWKCETLCLPPPP